MPQPTSRRHVVSGSLSAKTRPIRDIDRRRMASPMPHICVQRKHRHGHRVVQNPEGRGNGCTLALHFGFIAVVLIKRKTRVVEYKEGRYS